MFFRLYSEIFSFPKSYSYSQGLSFVYVSSQVRCMSVNLSVNELTIWRFCFEFMIEDTNIFKIYVPTYNIFFGEFYVFLDFIFQNW